MPNHVHNDLWITGPTEDVERLLQSVAGPDLIIDFNKIITYPEAFRIRDEEFQALGWERFLKKYGPGAQDGYNSGGYEWCTAHWGTKWNGYRQERRDYGGDVCVTFQTAWEPPIQVVAALHKLHPTCTLSLEYFEQGQGFVGGVRFLCEGDHYDEDKQWEPGTPSSPWRASGYKGGRGG